MKMKAVFSIVTHVFVVLNLFTFEKKIVLSQKYFNENMILFQLHVMKTK